MKYIGIRGNSSRNVMSYLIGHTLNYIIYNNEKGLDQSTDQNEYQTLFKSWCDDIISSEKAIHDASLPYVYFDSFGDTVRTFVSLLLGCDSDYLYDDYYKDHIIINIRDFSYKEYTNIPTDLELTTREELYKELSKLSTPLTITKNKYMTLRDFILYFGQDVMMKFFGLNVWVKSLTANESLFQNIFNDKSYRLYRDVKMPTEVTYIKNKDGIIIKIQNNSRKKNCKILDKLSKDTRYDYLINVSSDIYSMSDEIYNICNEIIKRDYGEESKKD